MSVEVRPEKIARDFKLAIAFWLGASSLAFVAVGAEMLHTQRKYAAILSAPGQTIGHWTEKNCARKGATYFTFDVGDKHFYGSQGTEVGECEGIKVGNAIDVVYYINNPENNFGGRLEDIAPIINRQPIDFAFAAFVSVVWFLVIVAPQWSRRRAAARATLVRSVPSR